MGDPKDDLMKIHSKKWGGRNRAIDLWLRANPGQDEQFHEFVRAFLDIRDEVGPKPMALQSLLDALLADDALGFDVESLPALRTWVREEFPDD